MFIDISMNIYSILCLMCVTLVTSKKMLNLQKSLNYNFVQKGYVPKGIQQELYVKHLMDSNVNIVAGVGAAGTGKTLFACDVAIKLLHNAEISKIIITRPTIAVENESFGFLPGDIQSKMNPWLIPIFDIFSEYFTQKEINKYIFEGVIEISPLCFMRGRTFKDCFIIADEIQNSTPSQMLMLTTRLGNRSKLVITGDLHQSDLKVENGLEDFIYKLKCYEKNYGLLDDIKLIEFQNSDIRRSQIVKKILMIYHESNIANKNKEIYIENDDSSYLYGWK
jgi:phosphate starvation-inducible PhoH-like protein